MRSDVPILLYRHQSIQFFCNGKIQIKFSSLAMMKRDYELAEINPNLMKQFQH